ncbi:hypothetical protein [Azohydromonas lata]|uniref:Ribbon-helix-helix protein CopG domain-containing protein n=1 Tax=Azohydromonas lata TaxID=45677 RepID=A0ABU5IEL5_9BURK|nr:hypothetical protein [Azohydromonas lata]MDZ5456981.1 hypothetical protein [Azohydromonas lata]
MPTEKPQRSPKGVSDLPIALDLPPAQMDLVAKYARGENRTKSAFARLLVKRGLAAYKKNPRVLSSVRVDGATSRRHIGLRLMPDEVADLEEGARKEIRSVALFARLLALVGLAEFEEELGVGT